ncbi:MAG: hypothetical protein IKG47_00315 [Oscillospiraceae bacterium]|nr:hypothetical protein [Clostridiales bacterium]MBR3353788.1 hypothetical protein [Oscillospiraceae bacterium]
MSAGIRTNMLLDLHEVAEYVANEALEEIKRREVASGMMFKVRNNKTNSLHTVYEVFLDRNFHPPKVMFLMYSAKSHNWFLADANRFHPDSLGKNTRKTHEGTPLY